MNNLFSRGYRNVFSQEQVDGFAKMVHAPLYHPKWGEWWGQEDDEEEVGQTSGWLRRVCIINTPRNIITIIITTNSLEIHLLWHSFEFIISTSHLSTTPNKFGIHLGTERFPCRSNMIQFVDFIPLLVGSGTNNEKQDNEVHGKCCGLTTFSHPKLTGYFSF